MLRDHREIQSGDTLYLSAVQHGLHGGSDRKKVKHEPEPSVEEGSDSTELKDLTLTSDELFFKKWREHNVFAKAIDTEEKKAKLKKKLSVMEE